MGRSLRFTSMRQQENQNGDEALDFGLGIERIWLISVLVLTSMTLQLILAFGGASRYQSSKKRLALSIWLAYMGSDGVATYALGTMLHSSQTGVLYALWAPLLLLHLGGPDTMTAYSTPDNELWRRHLFNMTYQSWVTIYVILSTFELGGEKEDWHLFVAAFTVLILGANKYAERIMALRLASYSKIVQSTLPIYEYMRDEHKLDKKCDIQDDNASQVPETSEEKCNYLVMGEERWFEKFGRGDFKWSRDSLSATGAITVQDIWEYEGEQFTENYVLCLAYALFKMYRRRYVHLYFHEIERPKTKRFFINLKPENIFKLMEIELKFMYDMLFSKSVMYSSRGGTPMRLLNAILLGVTWFLMVRGLKDAQTHLHLQERVVAHILISVAFFLELFQLCKILVSDWAMVWLVCHHIRLFHRPRRTDSFLSRIMKMIIWVIRMVRGNLCIKNQYWQNKIHQYCILDSCFPSSPLLLKAYRFCIKTDTLRSWYFKCRTLDFMEGWYFSRETIDDTVKLFLFEWIKSKCEQVQLEECKRKIFFFDDHSYLKDYQDLMWAIDCEMELQILSWHIATSIREKEDWALHHDGHNGTNFRVSRTLSRYCAFLMVSCPNILPVHPDIAKLRYLQIHFKVADIARDTIHAASAYQNLYEELPRHIDLNVPDEPKGTGLYRGIKIARQLQELQVEDRWKVLAEHWCCTVFHIAAYNKPELHAERLTFGGEFLTQIWTLLGHIGIARPNLQ